MEQFRIIVVDDSAFMRKLFSDIIASDPAFTVIAVGKNGREAVELHRSLKPDAITLDLEMPEMNGLDALRRIVAEGSTPVIMLSGVGEESTRETIAALSLGAFDFIRKPSGPGSDIRKTAEALLTRLRTAVSIRRPAAGVKPPPAVGRRADKPSSQRRIKPETAGQERAVKSAVKKAASRPAQLRQPGGAAARSQPPVHAEADVRSPAPERTSVQPAAAAQAPAPQSPPKPPLKPAAKETAEAGEVRHIIAIGTSTGGPRALHKLLAELPGDLPAALLIVQHMPPKFTQSLAQRLNSHSALQVKEAEHGEPIRPGVAYIAPGGRHMELAADGRRYVIRLTDAPPRNGHRPSVDTLFESLAPYRELARHAVIMTGMGSDGTRGMQMLADRGAVTTIAEAEETCTVYGMPRSAIEAGAAAIVLPLHDIPAKLIEVVKH